MNEEEFILSLHTEVKKDFGHIKQTHAWVELRECGAGRSFSMYLEGAETLNKKGNESQRGLNTDVRRDVDLDKTPTASLNRAITQEEAQRVEAAMDVPQRLDWRGNNCTHLALQAWEAGTGERFEAKSQVNGRPEVTPVGLELNIRERQLQANETRYLSDHGHFSGAAAMPGPASPHPVIEPPAKPSADVSGSKQRKSPVEERFDPEADLEQARQDTRARAARGRDDIENTT